jgi:hypothetical protein
VLNGDTGRPIKGQPMASFHKEADDKNPYNDSGCPACGEHAVGSCRCRGPHTMADLENGHGRRCKNGHHWSGTLVFTPRDKEAARKETYAVDLDGTLAFHDPDAPFKINEVGPPVEKMLARVKRWLAEGKKVVIFTARASRAENLPPIKAWLKEQGLPDLKITNEKTPDITRIYDDRAWHVERNTGEVKQAAFFTYDECRAEGRKAIAEGGLVRVHLHDPDLEHT